MSDSTPPETDNLLDIDSTGTENQDVSSTTPPFDEPAKEEEPSLNIENVSDEKEDTPAVEDLSTDRTETEEKPDEAILATKG